MEEKTSGIEIRIGDLWLILKRCWWLMLAVLVVVFSCLFIFEKVTYKEKYTATAVVWALGSNASSSSITSTSDVNIAKGLINDYKKLILTDDLLQTVIEKENLLIKPTQLRNMITIFNEEDTNVIEVSVTASKSSSAKKIADTLVDVFCERINAKNAEGKNEIIDGANADDGKKLVTVWSYAPLPEKPSNSVSIVKIGLIAFVAAVVVYGIFFVLYLLDDKISTAEDVEKYLGVSVLGTVPNRQDVMRRRRNKGGYYYYSYESPHTSDQGTQSANRGGNAKS